MRWELFILRIITTFINTIFTEGSCSHFSTWTNELVTPYLACKFLDKFYCSGRFQESILGTFCKLVRLQLELINTVTLSSRGTHLANVYSWPTFHQISTFYSRNGNYQPSSPFPAAIWTYFTTDISITCSPLTNALLMDSVTFNKYHVFCYGITNIANWFFLLWQQKSKLHSELLNNYKPASNSQRTRIWIPRSNAEDKCNKIAVKVLCRYSVEYVNWIETFLSKCSIRKFHRLLVGIKWAGVIFLGQCTVVESHYMYLFN